MVTDKRVLVAGASGLLGQHLIARLLKNGNEVHGLARFRDAGIRRRLEESGVRTFMADVGHSRFEDIPGLRRDYDVVIHEIALMVESEDDRPYTWQTNAYSAARLIDFCRDAGTFVVASTGGLYPAGDQARKETDALGAAGTYGATKIAMEALATYLCEKYAKPLALLRYHWPYSATKGMIPGMVQQVLRAEAIDINRTNRSIVHPMWIDDTVRFTLASVAKAGVPPFIVNMAGEQPVEREELALMIGRKMSRDPVIRDAPEFPKISHVADLARMHEEFGTCEVSLSEGIDRAIAAAQE